MLLDSVILIDHFNGIKAATDYLRSVRQTAAISVVTRAEVLVGFEEDELARPIRLLNHFPCHPATSDVADQAARLRRRYGWRLPDAFQAALARQHDLQLATRNTRDFDPERITFVVVPYRL